MNIKRINPWPELQVAGIKVVSNPAVPDNTAVVVVQPPLRAVKMGLFHTMDSLQSVVDLALSQLPITTPNAIVSLLMIYQNTLLNILEQETNFVPRKEL